MKPRPTDEEFAELRRIRDDAIEKAVADLCKEMGWERKKVGVHVSGGGCYCACSTGGPCQHIWDGPSVEIGEGGYSATCSLCGVAVFSHDIRVLP